VTAGALPLRAIGVVRNGVTEARDDGWGEVVSELHLDAELARGLDGIGSFSHALVLFWMHQATFDAARDLVRRPRGRADVPELGIFAQRAKHRPNPIGVATVAILERNGAMLRVRGLDAIDGTPVLDIKPYLTEMNPPAAEIREPAWVHEVIKSCS
jgi:tRNA-Thr(GGU) m(6)t(6)A37 methyltransferase TsaA